MSSSVPANDRGVGRGSITRCALVQRAWGHREGHGDGFTRRYGRKLLVWFELHETMETAILREKQIKAGSRAKKVALIESGNPGGVTCSL